MSIVVISTIIIYVALPTMGNMVGLAGIQAEDISDIKFVVPRESQEAWVLDDAMVIAEIISYFNGQKLSPHQEQAGGR